MAPPKECPENSGDELAEVSAPQLSEEEKAAIKIQAIFRGRKLVSTKCETWVFVTRPDQALTGQKVPPKGVT